MESGDPPENAAGVRAGRTGVTGGVVEPVGARLPRALAARHPGHRSVSVGVYSRAAEVPYVKERRGRAVKKLLLVALAAIGGFLVYRQIQADRAEQDLWTEATDSVPTGS
ncbi:hypothetical protein Sm713_58770 [Streptomyces sp. TS71-3]|nr:hypothetical protein Sm713_58770 [Streptomyces sp. TS71-3]